MSAEEPIAWIANSSAKRGAPSARAADLFRADLARQIRQFYHQIPGFRMSPLKGLPHLAARLGLGGVWVKDESARLNLGSFKVLGGLHAIYQLIRQRLGLGDWEVSFSELAGGALREEVSHLVFATATDGNHGSGVAWSAAQLGCRSVIYVHKLTSRERIAAIRGLGARVVVVDGTYDDAVRQVVRDAQADGWEVVSDTAWDGYESVPTWIMQGYTTLWSEAQEQLAAQGLGRPTHIFVQAGVGSLAAATIGFYAGLFDEQRPTSVVVEPTKAACLYESARRGDGEPVSIAGELDTIMAGLACGTPNPLAWHVLREYADYFAVCPDYVAAKGMRVYGVPLRGDPFVVSGESGAVTLGALMYVMEYDKARDLCDRLGLGSESQVLLINSEGNTAPDDFRHVVWEGGAPVPEQFKIHHAPVGNPLI